MEMKRVTITHTCMVPADKEHALIYLTTEARAVLLDKIKEHGGVEPACAVSAVKRRAPAVEQPDAVPVAEIHPHRRPAA